jgi:hypothetical protein
MRDFLTLAVAVVLAAILLTPAVAQEPIQQIEKEGIERTEQGQGVQKKVDVMHGKTRNTVDEYYAHFKLVEGLQLYNTMLGKQLQSQHEEIALLTSSISDVAIVSRQILPLMSRMVDALEQFIELDVPFLLSERRQRVAKMRALLLRADVTVAEKVRRVMEAYQVENDYGRTIEAYKAKLQLGDASFDADFLRIGRISLLYRTVGNDTVGYWNASQSEWIPLQSSRWRRRIEQGLKVARQEVAPELISIVLDPKQEIKR